MPVCHIVNNSFVYCLARPYPTDYQLDSKSLVRGCEHSDGGLSKLPCHVPSASPPSPSNGFFPAPALEADVIPFHPRHAYVIVEAGDPEGPKVINLVGKKGGKGCVYVDLRMGYSPTCRFPKRRAV